MFKICSCYLFISVYTYVHCHGSSCQHKLLNDLFNTNHYDKDMHPFNYSGPLEVHTETSLYQVLELDEKREELQVNMWFIFNWYDPFLTWRPEDYCGINEMTINWKRLWTPEIILYNRSDSNLNRELFSKTLVRVFYNGSVIWPTLAYIQTACKLNMKHFPFDKQQCMLMFGSWSENTSKLKLLKTSDQVNLDNYGGDGEWYLEEATMDNKVDDELSGSYSLIVITFKFKRRQMWYILNLVLPCLLLVTIGLLSFFLGPESGEKISLSVTLLLAMMLQQLMVAENLPPTSDCVPILTQIFTMSICTLGLATAAAILVMAVYQMGDRGTPPSLLVISLAYIVAIPLCLFGRVKKVMSSTKKKTSQNLPEVTKENKNEASTSKKKGFPLNIEPNNKIGIIESDLSPDHVKKEDIKEVLQHQMQVMEMSLLYQNLSELCEMYQARLQQHQCCESASNQWHVIANLMDRFFFVIFTLVTAGGILAIYLQVSDSDFI